MMRSNLWSQGLALVTAMGLFMFSGVGLARAAVCLSPSGAGPSVAALADPARGDESSAPVEAAGEEGPRSASTVAMEDVWNAIRGGDALVAASRYDAAIEAYQHALERLADAPEWAVQQNMVIRLLAVAHLGAFRVHGRAFDLHQARKLMQRYAKGLPEDSLDHQFAQSTIASIDLELKALTPTTAPAPVVIREPVKAKDQGSGRRRSQGVHGSARPLVVSGASLLGLGILGAVPAALGLGIRNRRWQEAAVLVEASEASDVQMAARERELQVLKRGAERMATLSVVATALSGAALISGSILLGTGLKRMTRGQRRSQASVRPWGRGLALGWRF